MESSNGLFCTDAAQMPLFRSGDSQDGSYQGLYRKILNNRDFFQIFIRNT